MNSNPVLNSSSNSNASAISALLMNAVQGIASQNNVQNVMNNVATQGKTLSLNNFVDSYLLKYTILTLIC